MHPSGGAYCINLMQQLSTAVSVQAWPPSTACTLAVMYHAAYIPQALDIPDEMARSEGTLFVRPQQHLQQPAQHQDIQAAVMSVILQQC